ncbi:MAG: hypothetical protein ACYC5H_15100 [Methylovirgula sp.]
MAEPDKLGICRGGAGFQLRDFSSESRRRVQMLGQESRLFGKARACPLMRFHQLFERLNEGAEVVAQRQHFVKARADRIDLLSHFLALFTKLIQGKATLIVLLDRMFLRVPLRLHGRLLQRRF